MNLTKDVIRLVAMLLCVLLWVVDCASGLMCYRCKSVTDPFPNLCRDAPPPPINCQGSSSQRYCMVAKELDRQGRVMNFIRDCTTVQNNNCSVTGLSAPSPYQVCYTTCRDNACNGATQPSMPAGGVLAATVILLLGTTLSALS